MHIYSYFHTEEPNNLEIGYLRRSKVCIVNVPYDRDTQAYIELKEILRIRNTSFLRKLSFPDNMSYLLCIVWRLGIFRKPPASFRGRKLTWNIGIENIAFFEASNYKPDSLLYVHYVPSWIPSTLPGIVFSDCPSVPGSTSADGISGSGRGPYCGGIGTGPSPGPGPLKSSEVF